MFQGALDQAMFEYWNLNGLEKLVKQLKEDSDIIRIELPGRKGARNIRGYYTFFTKDAIEYLKNWLKIRKEEGYGHNDPIFVSQYGTPLSKQALRHYWIDHLRKLGIVDPVKPRQRRHKTGKGLHEMRDVWRSLWSKSPASHVVGEYLMGHQIDDLGYDKSYRDVEYYREEYLKAAPYLNIISRGEAFGKVDKAEVDKLRKELQESKSNSSDKVKELEYELEQVKKQNEEILKLLWEKLPRQEE
jgi:hypothetical protein